MVAMLATRRTTGPEEQQGDNVSHWKHPVAQLPLLKTLQSPWH